MFSCCNLRPLLIGLCHARMTIIRRAATPTKLSQIRLTFTRELSTLYVRPFDQIGRAIFRSSSMAEHSAVNRRVVSSSLTCGANLINKLRAPMRCPFCFCDMDCAMTSMSQLFVSRITTFCQISWIRFRLPGIGSGSRATQHLDVANLQIFVDSGDVVSPSGAPAVASTALSPPVLRGRE